MTVCASRTIRRSFTLRPSSRRSMAVMAQRYSLRLGSTRDGGSVPGGTARVAPGATARVADWIWTRVLRFIWIDLGGQRPDCRPFSAVGFRCGFGEPAEGITAFTQRTSLVQILQSTGFLQGRTQGRRAPRARPTLTGVNGDGHLLVLDQQSEICGHVDRKSTRLNSSH